MFHVLCALLLQTKNIFHLAGLSASNYRSRNSKAHDTTVVCPFFYVTSPNNNDTVGLSHWNHLFWQYLLPIFLHCCSIFCAQWEKLTFPQGYGGLSKVAYGKIHMDMTYHCFYSYHVHYMAANKIWTFPIGRNGYL